MSVDGRHIAEVLMRYGEYTEDPADVEWLAADVGAVQTALAGGPDVVDTIPENAIYMALWDTAWFDPTQPGEVERAQRAAAEILEPA